jgi:hypothetical protein
VPSRLQSPLSPSSSSSRPRTRPSPPATFAPCHARSLRRQIRIPTTAHRPLYHLPRNPPLIQRPRPIHPKPKCPPLLHFRRPSPPNKVRCPDTFHLDRSSTRSPAPSPSSRRPTRHFPSLRLRGANLPIETHKDTPLARRDLIRRPPSHGASALLFHVQSLILSFPLPLAFRFLSVPLPSCKLPTAHSITPKTNSGHSCESHPKPQPASI